MARSENKVQSGEKNKRKHYAPAGGVSPEQRHDMIAQAAYFKAQRRGFLDGSTEEDWFEAESEIDAMLDNMAGYWD
jgi:hypothetical protein